MNTLKIIYQDYGTYSSKTFLTRTINQDIKNVKLWLFSKSHVLFNIYNRTIKTPPHVSIGQTVHESGRSKQLIQILNGLGICKSYDEIERQNCPLSLRTIHLPGNENVPLPPSIVPGNLVQADIDNFDHEEGTPSLIGGSYDTIMVVFQNNQQHQEKLLGKNLTLTLIIHKKTNIHFTMSSFE